MVGEEEKKQIVVEDKDIEELKIVLDTITPFLEKVKNMIKEILDMIMSGINGEKLGREVASLYQQLKQAGLPDEIVNEMVKDFYKKKLESLPSLNDLIKTISEAVKSPKIKIAGKEEAEEEKVEEAIKAVSEAIKSVKTKTAEKGEDKGEAEESGGRRDN